jgi:predicted HicB family RNase H-like nuclease
MAPKVILSIRIDRALKTALQKAAAAERRTLSQYVEHLLERRVKPAKPKQQRRERK